MEQEHVFIAATAVMGVLAFLLLWPFADAVLWAGFTAYFLHYFADRVDEYVQNRAITTGLMVVLLIAFVSALLYFLLTSVSAVVDLFSQFSQLFSGIVGFVIEAFDLPPALAASLRAFVTQISGEGQSWLVSQLTRVPALIVNLLIYLVVAVFLVKDGRGFLQDMFDTIAQLPEEYREPLRAVIASVDELFRGVFLSYFVVAVTVGTLASIGFYILGLDFWLGWGILIGLAGFLPIFSAPMVYGPLALLFMVTGQFWQGVVVLLFGIIVLNTLPEVILRPYIAAQHTHEHPLLLFTGFIIGPLVLGLKGIILGPIILVLAKDMLTMEYFDLDTERMPPA